MASNIGPYSPVAPSEKRSQGNTPAQASSAPSGKNNRYGSRRQMGALDSSGESAVCRSGGVPIFRPPRPASLPPPPPAPPARATRQRPPPSGSSARSPSSSPRRPRGAGLPPPDRLAGPARVPPSRASASLGAADLPE